MRIILTLTLFLLSVNAYAASGDTVDTNRLRDVLNGTPPGAAVRLGTKLVDRTLRTVRAKYDFSILGGFSTQSVGGYALLDEENKPLKIPQNAIIRNVLVDVTGTVNSVSSLARISLGVNTPGDLKVATAPTSYSSGSILAGVPVNTAATAIKVQGDESVVATITTNDLRSGKFFVIVDYSIAE